MADRAAQAVHHERSSDKCQGDPPRRTAPLRDGQSIFGFLQSSWQGLRRLNAVMRKSRVLPNSAAQAEQIGVLRGVEHRSLLTLKDVLVQVKIASGREADLLAPHHQGVVLDERAYAAPNVRTLLDRNLCLQSGP